MPQVRRFHPSCPKGMLSLAYVTFATAMSGGGGIAKKWQNLKLCRDVFLQNKKAFSVSVSVSVSVSLITLFWLFDATYNCRTFDARRMVWEGWKCSASSFLRGSPVSLGAISSRSKRHSHGRRRRMKAVIPRLAPFSATNAVCFTVLPHALVSKYRTNGRRGKGEGGEGVRLEFGHTWARRGSGL